MANLAAVQQPTGSLASLDAETMQHLVAGGDCSRLSPAQKIAYYTARCEAAGLDPRAQPFAFVKLSGREVLYAQKAASDQLAAKHGVRMTIVSQTTEDGIRVVTVRAEAKDGRVTEEIGALPVKGLSGEALSNAMMKCVTKAKRRAILSLCGLGMLDETEVESIPQAHSEPAPVPASNVEAAAKVLEAEVVKPPPPVHAPPPPYVLALWTRAKKELGPEAKGKFETAVLAALGKDAKPSHAWTREDCGSVEAALFPADVSF